MAGRDNRRWGLALAVAYGAAVGVAAATSERQPPRRMVEMPPQQRRRRPTLWMLSTLLAVGGLGGGLAAATTLGPEIGQERTGVVASGGSGSASSAAPHKTPHPAAETVRTEPTPTARPEPPPTAAEVAVATALEQIGKPYRWAATGPSAFDCSGLTSFAWRAAGVEVPRTSRAQFASLPRVSPDELQPGDLIYSPGHIGMFIGDGQMVHAPLSGRDVEVAPLRQPMHGAVRPAPADMPAA